MKLRAASVRGVGTEDVLEVRQQSF